MYMSLLYDLFFHTMEIYITLDEMKGKFMSTSILGVMVERVYLYVLYLYLNW